MADACPVVISLEGGIGIGKTTVISKLKTLLDGVSGVVFVDEPVDEWLQSGLLQAMYKGTLNTSTFQHMVLMSLAADLGRVILYQKPVLIIIERSPVSNYYVFAKENLSGCELDSYKFVWDRFMGICPPGLESHYIYLDAPTAVLADRIRTRDRSAEDSVSAAYMDALDKRHKAWLENEPNAHTVDASADGNAVFNNVVEKLRWVVQGCGRASQLGAVLSKLVIAAEFRAADAHDSPQVP
jgi:deoxyadenosine/deoxycytidine kinase